MHWLSASMPRWYAVAVTAASVMLIGFAGVAYTNYSLTKAGASERESDRRWCSLLVTLDSAYGSTPPTTELGRRVAAAIHALRDDLECPATGRKDG